jgi:DNA-binding LacI/PurR family transcriptional regulator
MPVPVTMQQIAKRVGVSPVAVSYALADKPGVGERTRQRILRTAVQMGYRTNIAARSTRTGRFGAVALLISTEPNRSTLPDLLMRGVIAGLDELDLQLMITMLPDEKLSNEGFVPRILRHSMSDGLLINYTDNMPQKMIELIHDHHVPSVWMNSKLAEDAVYPDDIQAGRLATEHLLALGHRRIAFAEYSRSGHYSIGDRYAGYAQAMQTAGLQAQQLGLEAVPAGERVAYSRQWLSAPDRPSAVIAYGGGTSDPICHAAVSLGLRLPVDLSIVHFGGQWISRFADLRFTTVVVPEEAVGREAVAMLDRKIANPLQSQEPVVIPFVLESGDTVSPATSSR